jgi:hypothetical protein
MLAVGAHPWGRRNASPFDAYRRSGSGLRDHPHGPRPPSYAKMDKKQIRSAQFLSFAHLASQKCCVRARIAPGRVSIVRSISPPTLHLKSLCAPVFRADMQFWCHTCIVSARERFPCGTNQHGPRRAPGCAVQVFTKTAPKGELATIEPALATVPKTAPNIRADRFDMVPEVRFELTHPQRRRILSPLRLPFRHSGPRTAHTKVLGAGVNTGLRRQLHLRRGACRVDRPQR